MEDLYHQVRLCSKRPQRQKSRFHIAPGDVKNVCTTFRSNSFTIDFRSAYVTQFSINTNQDHFFPHVSQITLQFIVRHWRDLSTSKVYLFL